MKRLFFASFIFFILFSFSFSFVTAVFADNAEQATLDNAVDQINKGFGKDLVTVDKNTDPAQATSQLVGRIIKIALGIIGTISLIVFLYSGIMWMLAGDNATALTDAKKSMVWAAIGLFAIFVSYTMITYVIKAIAF